YSSACVPSACSSLSSPPPQLVLNLPCLPGTNRYTRSMKTFVVSSAHTQKTDA
ncbi:hypothetical protein L9F63_012617, partial [Diploptera punctata]